MDTLAYLAAMADVDEVYSGVCLAGYTVRMTHELAMRLLHATREQLHDKPTREIVPVDVAQYAGINPYHCEYDETVSYLLSNGYIEPHPNAAYAQLGLYRVTNKGLEEVMSGTH